MDQNGQDLIEAALDYVTRRGFAVFPCRSRAKVPATEHGFYDAVKDRDKVAALWSGRIDSNVAIRTGKESGIVVLDKDPRNGGNDSLSKLERIHGKLPETPTAQSGRGDGGEHYYFKYPDDGLPVPKQTLAPGLDILSDGGYVMAPPSIHPDSGLPYHWKPGSGLDETPVAEMPGWLLALIRAEQHTANGKGFTPPPVFEGGERNNHLYKTGRKLHASFGSSEAEILATLLAINQERCKEPLTREEVEEIAHNCATQKDRADFKAQKNAPARNRFVAGQSALEHRSGRTDFDKECGAFETVSTVGWNRSDYPAQHQRSETTGQARTAASTGYNTTQSGISSRTTRNT